MKVPNTRGIHALPRMATAPADDAAPAAWGLKNQLLSAGLLCVLAGVLGLGYLFWTRPVSEANQMAVGTIHYMDIPQLLQQWEMLHEGFRPISTPRMEHYEHQLAENRRWMWMAGIVVVGGAAMISASFLSAKKR